MKKDYMKPEGKVVAVSVQENIASSDGDALVGTFKIDYSIDTATGVKYIWTSSVPASNTGNKAFDSFYDLVQMWLPGNDIPANCRQD